MATLDSGCSIIIATRNRPEPLKVTLESILTQSRLPSEIVIVDSSDGEDSRQVIEDMRPAAPFPLVYEHSSIRSAARQRNRGVQICREEIVLFLDDDVILERVFLEELLRGFSEDSTGEVAGVSGMISNDNFTPLSWLNRLLLWPCLGWPKTGFGGRVLGPAVNFLPADRDVPSQPVDWIPSCCGAYRKELFLLERFPEYEGYSFAEDLHLATRMRKRAKLINRPRARLFHADMGKKTHADWGGVGESLVHHRYEIMTSIMGRTSLTWFLRLFYYEGIYQGLVVLRQYLSSGDRNPLRFQLGRYRALVTIWRLHHS